MGTVWTIQSLMQRIISYFKGYGIESARFDAEVLIANVLKKDRLYLYTHWMQPLGEAELEILRRQVKARVNGQSVAVIIGYKEFMGLSFEVSPDVLVPRADTEILVEQVLMQLPDSEEPLVVADIGVGSGAILLSLLHYRSNWQGIGIDISSAALDIAKDNAKKINVFNRIKWSHSDFGITLRQGAVDVLVSNPPYIRTADLSNLPLEVQAEPHLALDGGGDGLIFYRRIIDNAKKWVKRGGLIAVEIGYDQGAAVLDLIRSSSGYTEPVLVQDFGKRDRVVMWNVL